MDIGVFQRSDLIPFSKW